MKKEKKAEQQMQLSLIFLSGFNVLAAFQPPYACLWVSYPLCQLRMCCGLQGGVGVAACSLDGVILLWL